MSDSTSKKPLLHRLAGWPSLALGGTLLSLCVYFQDWTLGLIGGCVIALSIAELIATPTQGQ